MKKVAPNRFINGKSVASVNVGISQIVKFM